MGLLDDAASVISGAPSQHSRKHKSRRSHRGDSRSRSRSGSRRRHSSSAAAAGGIGGIAASIFGGGGDDDDRHHHSSSKKNHGSTSRSFFGLAGGNNSRSSFFGNFGVGGSGRSPSYYKRSPRPNFVSRVVRRLKRLLRDLVYYAKRHPLKVFMLVIMPLVTGGFLTALLAKFGLRLPASLTSMLGLATKAATGDSIGLVGEAVRMAGGLSGGGGVTKASIERGRDGNMQWERRHVEKDAFGGGAGGWGGGLMGIAKMFS